MRRIRIEGPGKNALGTARMRELLAALDDAGTAPLLLTGAGDAFSAGLDLAEVGAAGPAEMETFLDLLGALLTRLFHHPAPVVAAVNGHAIAGGCLVMLAADHRVCTDNPRTRIGLNEVALGLRFPPQIVRMVRARLPAAAAETVMLGSELHPPADALRLGLVDELAADPLAVATEILERRAAHPAAAYAATKRALRQGLDTVTPAEETRFRAEVLPVWYGPEIKAVIAGFFNR